MAMTDAYRIGVDLVLGGDLAAGIEALIPGLERLDARITHANAEAAELATGLHDVAEAAPGIGRAADQMGRLRVAMAGVNKAVEAWRAHGGVPAGGVPQAEESKGTAPHRAAPGRMAGLPREVPAVVPDFDFGDGKSRSSGRRLPGDGPDVPSGLGASVLVKPRERPIGGVDAVMPALLAGELVKSDVAGRVDGVAKGAEGLAGGNAPSPVPPGGITQLSMMSADAAKGTSEVYAAAPHALPVYARDALAAGGSGIGASFEPMLNGLDLGRTRAEEVEDVMPTLTRRDHRGAVGEVLLEAHPFVQQPPPMIDDALAPVIGVRGGDGPVREHGTSFDSTRADSRLAVKDYANSLRALRAAGIEARERATEPRAKVPSYTLAASAKDAPQRFGIATINVTPEWFKGIPDGPKAALAGLSSDGMVSSVKDGLAAKGRESLFTLAGGLVGLNGAGGKMPDAATGAAGARAPGLVGAGFVPSLTVPCRDQGRGMSTAPDWQGYHPKGEQPGPVIQHITYLHLDDREIARVVTRQQLRMMGGNVSGTLRPDPSIAPHYGAHLLET